MCDPSKFEDIVSGAPRDRTSITPQEGKNENQLYVYGFAMPISVGLRSILGSYDVDRLSGRPGHNRPTRRLCRRHNRVGESRRNCNHQTGGHWIYTDSNRWTRRWPPVSQRRGGKLSVDRENERFWPLCTKWNRISSWPDSNRECIPGSRFG